MKYTRGRRACLPVRLAGIVVVYAVLASAQPQAAPPATLTVYEGVPLREVLKRAGVPAELRGKALTSYVVAKARDNYQVVFTEAELDPEFGNEQILVADKRNGTALDGTQGPFRLVCVKDRAGARSVRMLERLEVVRLLK